MHNSSHFHFSFIILIVSTHVLTVLLVISPPAVLESCLFHFYIVLLTIMLTCQRVHRRVDCVQCARCMFIALTALR